MAMEDSGMMSPADIAALTRGNTGFGGDGISWLVLILLFFGFMGGGWGGRYGNGELGQYGNCIRLANNSVVIRSSACPCNAESVCGYYTVSVNTTLTASAAGTVTVSLYQDGQLVPGAVQSATAAAANDLMNFSITAPIRVYRGQLSSKLQIYVNSQQVNTMNVAVEVVKE